MSSPSMSFLQPPPGRRYVRSFLFSRHINAPLGHIHLIARTLLVLCLSAAQLRTIDTHHPDLLGAAALWILSLLLFLGSGISRKVARGYVLLMVPALLVLFLTWTLLTPLPGLPLLHRVVYDGTISIGPAAWQLIWLLVFIGYFWWRRGIAGAVLIASLVSLLCALLLPLPSWPWTHIAFLSPLTLLITDQTIRLALTKVVGYSGMVFSTVALVIASRDTELIGTLRQLRMPQAIIFFVSTVCRALNLALTDFDTIHQAQVARAVNARRRHMLSRLSSLASIAVPMVAIMIRRSSEIGDALQARGYRLGRGSVDYYESSPWHFWDVLVLLLSLALLTAALLPHPPLSSLISW